MIHLGWGFCGLGFRRRFSVGVQGFKFSVVLEFALRGLVLSKTFVRFTVPSPLVAEATAVHQCHFLHVQA